MTITDSELLIRLMNSLDSLRDEISSLRVEMGKYSVGISLIDSRVSELRIEVKDLEKGISEISQVCETCQARKNLGNLSTFGRWLGVVLAVLVSVAALGQSLNWWGGSVTVQVGR